jgi:predicted HNH restriction endonuclease
MARWNDLPWREEVYAAADIWKERCLLNDGALFSDDSIWTATNLSTLQDLVISNADPGSGNFRDKLFQQLSGASSNTVQLAAELMWLIYLFPLGQQVEQVTPSTKAATKSQKVNEILKWGGLPTPTGEVVTVNALSGIGRTGRYYTRYWHALQYMLEIFIAWKGLPYERKVELREEQNAWEFAKWSDHFEQQTQVPFRHALLFFLFPNNFERMVSFSHKQEVVRDYWHKLSAQDRSIFFNSGGFEDALSVDKAVFVIRKDLEQEKNSADLDFYRGDLDGTWGMEHKPFPSKDQTIDNGQIAKSQQAMNNDGEAGRLEHLEEREDADEKLSEGEKILLSHYRRERRPQLRETKLRALEKKYGVLKCECCGTEAESYPPHCRQSVFEVHHKRPLSEGPTLTGMDDLALLCANCHRAIHAEAELPKVDDFSQKIRKLT